MIGSGRERGLVDGWGNSAGVVGLGKFSKIFVIILYGIKAN